MKQTKKYVINNETFRFDSKHYKYHAARTRANKIRWSGYKAHIRSTNNNFVVYKGSKRIRKKR